MNISTKENTYLWSGVSKLGIKSNGKIQATSRFYAKIKLKHQGIEPLRVYRKFNFTSVKPTEMDIALFCRQLSTLLNAGVSLTHACATLKYSEEKTHFRNMITSIEIQLNSGKNLTNCVKQFPTYFDSFTQQLIQLGENTGKLDHCLLRIANYKEKMLTLKKQIQQTLFYPITICIISLIVMLIMLIFIIPRFAELFHNMHHQLPFLTECVLSISQFLIHYDWIFLFIMATFIILIHHSLRSAQFKSKVDRLIIRLPIIGILMKKNILAKIARNLATAISAGMTISDTLRLLSSCTRNLSYTQAIHRLHYDIARGLQLHSAMQPNPLFPPVFVQMIKVGEETGMLDTMLEKIAILYEADVDHFIAYLKQLLEPLIMIILGVLIGGMVIAMYLPVFKLGTVF